MSDREKTMGALQRLFKRIEYAEQRAQRAEAECERLRAWITRAREAGVFEAPDAPQPPEQAHGDALADLDYLSGVLNNPQITTLSQNGWVELRTRLENVRKALTASGVPEGDYHEGFEEGMRAGHGVPYAPPIDEDAQRTVDRLCRAAEKDEEPVQFGDYPYVPEEVRRLPESWRNIEARYPGSILNRIRYQCADELEAAIDRRDSAPAVERVPVEVAKRVIAARDAMISGDVQEVWYQLYRIADPDCTQPKPWAELERIAAAPQRGGEHE